MGDGLAAIREKAQAHQEESKAKRFRDRGGLWQPLSPSKNMLLGILNSAEFRNIVEAGPVIQQKEEPKPALSQKLTKGQIKSATNGKGQEVPFEAKDDLGHKGKRTAETDVVKQRRSRKPITKPSHRGKTVSDPDIDQVPGGETTLFKRKLLPSPESSLNVKESQQKVAPTMMEDAELGESSSQPRAKRATRKRNFRELASEQEDEVSDHQPSLVKKPRARGAVKTASIEPKSKKRVKDNNIAHGRSKAEQTETGLQGGHLVENRGSVSTPSDPDPANTSKSSRQRGCKRGFTTETPSDDEEQPSPPKRRRTKAKVYPDPKPKTRTVSVVDSLPLDVESLDSVENLKPCARKASNPKPPAKPNSRYRTKGKSRAVSSDEGSDLETNADHGIFVAGKTKTRARHLSTIMEDEEDDEDRKLDKGRIKVPKAPKPLSKVIISPAITPDVFKPPSQGRHGASNVDNEGNLFATLGRTEDGILARAPKIKAKAGSCAHTSDNETAGNAVPTDSPKKTAYTGMTKRRRKKVKSEIDGTDVKGTCPIMATAVEDAGYSHHEPTVKLAQSKGTARTKARHTSPLIGVEPPLSQTSPYERSQNKVFSVDVTVGKAPPKTILLKKASSTAQLKTKAVNHNPRSVQNKGDVTSRRSSQRSKEASQEIEHKGYESKKAVHPPPLLDTHFETIVESDADELDLLS